MFLHDTQKPLFQWVKTIRAFRNQHTEDAVDDSTSVSASHNIMNAFKGGLLYVSVDDAKDFLDRYTDDVQNGIVHYLSENRNKVFRMYCDVDIKRNVGGPITDSEILEYSKVISDTVRKFYPVDTRHDVFDIIVLRNGTKEIYNKTANDHDAHHDDHNHEGDTESAEASEAAECANHDASIMVTEFGEVGTVQWKTGVHLVWPRLEVTQMIALTMREAILGRLHNEFGSLTEIQNSWSDIIDECVYTTNGLRMPYSNKCEICPECRSKKDRIDNCNTCIDGMNGRIDSGRPYKPWALLSNGKPNAAEFKRFVDNPYRAMALMSIRVDSEMPTPGWVPYEGAPRIPITLPPEKQILMIDPASKKMVREFAEDAKAVSRIHSRIDIPFGDPMYNAMEWFLHKHTSVKQWEGIQVHRIFTNPKNAWYQVQVRGDGSSYCLNYRRDHRSNRIYFMVKPEGVYQKCYCRCDTTKDRLNGKCADYMSKVYPMTLKLKDLFWQSGGITQLGHLYQDRNETISKNPDGHLAAVRAVLANICKQIETDEENDFGVLGSHEHHHSSARPPMPKKDLFAKPVPLDDLVDTSASKRKSKASKTASKTTTKPHKKTTKSTKPTAKAPKTSKPRKKKSTKADSEDESEAEAKTEDDNESKTYSEAEYQDYRSRPDTPETVGSGESPVGSLASSSQSLQSSPPRVPKRQSQTSLKHQQSTLKRKRVED